MSIELEHAIGCNVEFKRICHLHPNGKDYVKAVGGVIIIGDLEDPHEQVFCQGHDDFITCLTVSHNGQMLASGQQGQNADVLLWSFETKSQLACFQEQDHGIDALAFSHDDRFLISCGDIVDQRVFVYDTSSRLIMAWAQLSPKPSICVIAGGMVRDIKRRDTQEYQFASCGGKNISMWHLDHVRGELAAHQVGNAFKQVREYVCLAYTQDYEYLLAGTTTGDVAVILMKNRVVQNFLAVCGGGVANLVCTPVASGTRFVVVGGDGTVTVIAGSSPLDLREERQVRLDGPLTSLSLAPDAAEVLAVSTLGTSYLIRSKDLSIRPHSQVSPGALYDVAYLAGISDHFLTCSGDGLVALWDANDYTAKLRCGVGAPGRAHPLAACGTEDIIVAGATDGRLFCWDCNMGQNLWHIDNAHKGGATSALCVAACRAEEIRVWELKTCGAQDRKQIKKEKEKKQQKRKRKQDPDIEENANPLAGLRKWQKKALRAEEKDQKEAAQARKTAAAVKAEQKKVPPPLEDAAPSEGAKTPAAKKELRMRNAQLRQNRKLYEEPGRILLVGEGNFSFGRALCQVRGSGEGIYATAFDGEASLKRKYADAPQMRQEIEEDFG
ncbi:CFAP52 [Symbiodinium sp. CCMP2592]|nr:CFAP52 [Symbiodinium sp. CCMP2592]